MTVAVMVKVFDGMVLATDSAATMATPNGHQVYNNASKIFNLHRRLPIAAMTWGLGNLGAASISIVAKDLRARLMGEVEARATWGLEDDSYTVEQVAAKVVDMMFDEMYAPLFQEVGYASPTLGLLVAGYSAGADSSEAWKIMFESPSDRPVPELIAAQNIYGWESWAQPEATERLFNGFGPSMVTQLRQILDPEEWAKVEPLFDVRHVANPAQPAMPLADAIGLAKFMVEVTAGFSHYNLGPDTVVGPVEVASMNRHEGFKWINRKHYFAPELNPRSEHGH